MYTILPSGVLRSDGACIPADPNNSDYAGYLAWVAAGNTATPHTAAAPSTDQQISALLSAAGVERLTVQICIEVSEEKARRLAPSYNMTEAQAIAYAYASNKSYRTCKDLEAQIRALETS